MMMRVFHIPLLIAFTVFSGFSVYAANFTSGIVQGKSAYIWLSGSIVNGDGTKFKEQVNQLNRAGYSVDYVYLSSSGGQVSEAQTISDWVKRYNVITIVPKDSSCASACFSIFAAGYQKIVDKTSKIGVHRISIGGKDTDVARSFSIGMNDHYEALKVPSSISYKMLTTPPEKMYWLSSIDYRAMNVKYLTDNSRLHASNLVKIPAATKEAEVTTNMKRSITIGGKTIPLDKSGVYRTDSATIVVINN